MNSKIAVFFKNPLMHGLFFVSAGSILGSFLSYYFNFLVQSLFPDFSDYGDFVFILTFLTLSQIIPGSISGTLNLIVTELKVKNEFAKLTLLYIRMLVLFGLVGFGIGFFVFALAPQLSDIFQIKNLLYVQLLGLVIFLTTISIPNNSFLYGLLRFKSFSLNNVLSILLKVLLTLFFYYLGFGFISILYAYILGPIISFFIGISLLIVNFDSNFKNQNINEYYKRIFLTSLPLFFIIIGSSILSQIDFLILKNKLSTEVAGMYGYLTNFGKIYYFGSLVLVGAMAPQVTESFNKKENFYKIMFFYFKIISPLALIGFSILNFFPHQFLNLFIFFSTYLGLNPESLNKFYEILPYLPNYAIFMFIYVLVNFFTIFFIATSNFKIYLSYILAILLQSLLIFGFADDINTAINYNIYISFSLLVYLIYEIYRKYLNFSNSSDL